MARAPNEKIKKAFGLYKRGYKLVDIAKELNIPVGTIRSWKSRYNWDDNATLQKDKDSVATNKDNKKKSVKKSIVEEAKDILKNTDLTEKQRLFCIYYIENFNATKAYQKAYEVDYKTANANGSRMLVNASVKKEIAKLTNECLEEQEIESKLINKKILQKYIDIAFSDIGEYVSFGRERKYHWTKDKDGNDIPVIDPETGKQKFSEYNIVNLNESKNVDTSLLSEISEGREGVKIKLYDKMKALDFLTEHYSSLSSNEKTKLDLEYQRLKNSKLEVEINNLIKQETKGEGIRYTGIPSTMIAPAFAKTVFDIENGEYLEYVFPGGRGSTKSSFVSLEVIDQIMKNENMHAVVMRQVADTLRTSVYQQVLWAISALDLEDEFHCTVSPLEITRKSTGQKIYFRGADDPNKIKSIKVPFGYIGILWLEELDQFTGPEAVRKIEQSVIRGGDKAYIFKSFNPPKTANNWANKYIKIPKATRKVVESTYLDVPKQWLGKPFIDEAEFLKEVNPDAYENEYMGVANGNGGNVFDNVQIRAITDEEINRFDRLYNGVDWGWFPDPWAFNRMYYDAARRDLYIFDEAHENKKSNQETAKILKEKHNIKPNDKVTCDSAEEKSVSDYKSYGLFARGAIKGPGSVEYSMKWLQSLHSIIIDNARCPHTAEEFLDYEYERDKDDNIISGYPDKDNHHIDAVRYAMEEVWRRRGR